MEHYVVLHTVNGENNVETFSRLFDSIEDARKFALQVAESYRGLKVTECSNAVTVTYGDSETIDYLLINKVVDDSTARHCPRCGRQVSPSTTGSYRWHCADCGEDFFDFQCV